MHPLVKLAKDSVEEYTRTGKIIGPPDKPAPEMALKAGVFVSLKKKGQLRGCIGTFLPVTESVADEIIRNALSAATQDPRFAPVAPEELDGIEYSVDILTEPERVSGKQDLDPRRYGVIVISGELRGLLLPDLEGIDTVDEQVRIASMKAGIGPGQDIELYRFEVKRYK